MIIPKFDYLQPTLMLLSLFMLLTLALVLINPKSLKIDFFYVISLSVVCILTTVSLYVALGFIVDEFFYGIGDASIIFIFISLGLAILNPIIFKIKNRDT